MNVENLIYNDEYKLMFLKAVLLGINYGKSEQSNFYSQNINSEINKLIQKTKTNNDTTKYDILIKKNEIHMYKLENQKQLLLSDIQKLSRNNYAYNHSRINLLKINLEIIFKDIEKLKINIRKLRELKTKQQNIPIIEIKEKVIEREQENKEDKNIMVGELEKTFDSLSSLLF